jgi:integrase/recombinase XerD
LELQEYLQAIRPRINKGESPQLFVSLTGSENLKNSIKHLMEDLRKIDPQVKNGQQIRKSVIVNWLKEKDIRQVQYLAGHSSISSTERYKAANLEELEEALKVHHPLK